MPPVLLLQLVDAGVMSHPVHPGEETAGHVEAGQLLVDADERLLGQILGLVVIAAQTVGQGKDLLLVTLDQYLEGLGASVEDQSH